MIKVFVSHSSEDEFLASALIDCLMAATNLNDDEIRCTSVPGHRLEVGADSATTLRDELEDTATVVGLITQHSIGAGWVLFELGAAWGAKKKLKPIITDDIEFKNLPGPLSGRHAARLSQKSDLSQFIDEIAAITGASKRTGPKIDASIDKLIVAHREHVKLSSVGGGLKTVKTSIKEPIFSGIPFFELVAILRNEIVKVPASAMKADKDAEIPLFDVFLANYERLAGGLQSNVGSDTPNGFLYHKIALRLFPYNLVLFDKLPAAQAKFFKRLILSADGHKFVAHWNRLSVAKNSKKPG